MRFLPIRTIPEDVKQAANEEMVKTAKLGDEIGTEEASALVTKIKEEMAENPPTKTEEVREVVESSANELGIVLNEDQKQSLIDLFNKLKELNIDWNAVGISLQQQKISCPISLSPKKDNHF